jgi:hypothetical protein
MQSHFGLWLLQEAVMEVHQNPMAIVKYQEEEEVMKVFNKMAALFPAAAGAGGPGGFPGEGSPYSVGGQQ